MQQQVFEDGPEAERGKECQCADDQDHAHQQHGEQRRVDGKCPG